MAFVSMLLKSKLFLFVLCIVSFVCLRNTFHILVANDLALEDELVVKVAPSPASIPDASRELESLIRQVSESLGGNVAGPIPATSHWETGHVREDSPVGEMAKGIINPPDNKPIQVLKDSSHNSANITKSKPSRNNTEHTLLKANMSHVGEIVKGINAEAKGDKPVKVAKPHPFKYVINSPNICGKDEVFMLIYIHTAPDHHKRRTVIRQTWGKIEQYTEVTVRLVFVMGLTKLTRNLTEIQKAVMFESEQYGDIVQEDFLDTYHNLSHKGVTALKWITNYCSQAKYILKTDDDIFVNMYTLLKHMRIMEKRGNTTGILMCAVWYQMTVLRSGKWKVTVEEWPNSTYPTYCSGSAFILSTDVAITMYRVSYHVPFFWVDDFYITGLLPLKAGNITHTSFGSTFVLNGDLLEEMFTGSQWYLYIFSHVHNLNRIQAVWDTMTRMAKGEIAVPVKTALPGDLESQDSIDRRLGLF